MLTQAGPPAKYLRVCRIQIEELLFKHNLKTSKEMLNKIGLIESKLNQKIIRDSIWLCALQPKK
jgi:hypothetical protein